LPEVIRGRKDEIFLSSFLQGWNWKISLYLSIFLFKGVQLPSLSQTTVNLCKSHKHFVDVSRDGSADDQPAKGRYAMPWFLNKSAKVRYWIRIKILITLLGNATLKMRNI